MSRSTLRNVSNSKMTLVVQARPCTVHSVRRGSHTREKGKKEIEKGKK